MYLLPGKWPAGSVRSTSLHMAGADRSLIRAAAQWQIDISSPHDEELPHEHRNLFAVTESLLIRSATPFYSPSLEEHLAAASV